MPPHRAGAASPHAAAGRAQRETLRDAGPGHVLPSRCGHGCSCCHQSLTVPNLHAGPCRRRVRVRTPPGVSGKGDDCTQDTRPQPGHGLARRSAPRPLVFAGEEAGLGHVLAPSPQRPGEEPSSAHGLCLAGEQVPAESLRNTPSGDSGATALPGRVAVTAGALVGLGNFARQADGQGPLRPP